VTVESRFGASPALSLGVEEELMILDGETLMPSPSVDLFVHGTEERPMRGRLKTELHASVVELNTDVCATPQEALVQTRELYDLAAEIAAPHGLVLAAGGSHPLVRPEELEIVPEQRYLEMVELLGPSARRQGVSGLHVHVGMPTGDDCLRTLEWILPWLPVVLALSANSPYMAGAETGLLSSRAAVLAELPRSGGPPAFASYAEWEAFVERLRHLGVAADYTLFWWDVRPHPRLGTLELRIADQPTSPSRTAGFVALLQALCAVALESDAREPDPAGRAIYSQNRWAAGRFGPRAELVHPDEDRLMPASELAAELLDLVRPAVVRLGSESLLHALVPTQCEADRQLEIGRADGLQAVCAYLVDRR
jgi:glutamate---cysteine ligase / carboxylate-amine ligase